LTDANSKILNEKPENLDFYKFDQSELLNMVNKEALRLFNPFIVTTPRKLTKNITLGPYKLKKGLNLTLPVLTIHRNEDYHKNAMDFDVNRYNEDNKEAKNPMTNLPFFVGKRNCLGKSMGELMVKIVVSHMLKHLEWKRDSDYEPKKVQNLTYIHKEMKLWARPRVI
jgi:cytochrome P450